MSLSENKSSCILSINSSDSGYNKTIFSRVSLNFTNISKQGFIENSKEHQIQLSLVAVPNYTLSLKNSFSVFSPIKKEKSVFNVPLKALNVSDSLFSLNLTGVTSGYYYMSFSLKVSHNQVRMLLESLNTSSLPETFEITYQSSDTYFVGTSEEIQQETSSSGSASKEEKNDFNADLFAILFSIFMFFFIVIVIIIVVVLVKRRKKMKKSEETKFSAMVMSPTLPTNQMEVSPIKKDNQI